MITVFRVEKQDGTGPYSGDDYIIEMVDSHNDDFHKTPQADPLLRESGTPDIWLGMRAIASDEFCCFQTEADLYAWFDEWEYDLAMNGHGVAIYTVPDNSVRHGERQSVFKRADAKLLGRSPLKLKEYA